MKILQISRTKDGLMNSKGSVNGGLEKVIIDNHLLFTDNGFDSHIIDSVDSSFEDCNSHKLITGNSRRDNITIAEFSKNFDVIIVHSRWTILSYLNRLGVKYIYIDHFALTGVNQLMFEKTFTTDWVNAKANGSVYYTVSPAAIQYKEKSVSKWADPNFKFDGFIKFQYLTEELENQICKEGEGYINVISRPSSEKKLHYISKLKRPYKAVSTKPDNEEGSVNKDYKEYYDSSLKAIEDNIVWNISREQTLDILSRSSAYYSTCAHESAGISGFEALCSGVPLIVHENTNIHASRMFAPEGADYIVSHKDSEGIDRIMSFTLEQRKRIIDEVRSMNTKQNFIDSYVPILKSVMNKRSVSIEEFF